jgi:hypothetical protein
LRLHFTFNSFFTILTARMLEKSLMSFVDLFVLGFCDSFIRAASGSCQLLGAIAELLHASSTPPS